ncbi:uncharacterized protein LY89DRAFT_678962 [Mollisia scopiformis]|uniref:Uncharacterized protein n=1 Tax=Mollisia scopiformis TaxID=149040 RepID=A0A132B1H9_MOLSC|nr:uncharacterized protein LY89DRAFT_678962 [Mollisia scopiformis]KUJ06236.1 hypothetical protein LY89DRAFT_678962 [Mollisia scopiformis]
MHTMQPVTRRVVGLMLRSPTEMESMFRHLLQRWMPNSDLLPSPDCSLSGSSHLQHAAGCTGGNGAEFAPGIVVDSVAITELGVVSAGRPTLSTSRCRGDAVLLNIPMITLVRRVMWVCQLNAGQASASASAIGEMAESSAKAGTGKGLHYCHPMFETTTGLPLVFNPIIFLLAMALASNAFKDYQTDDEIFALEPPVYDEIEDVPVFQATSCNGPTGKIQKACTCARQLSGAAQRAGFLNCTVYAIRREALVKANANGYADAELMKFSEQSGPEVFQTFYMAEGGVDGQNSFLNQPLRKDHLESFRGMFMQCNPELWQSLPAQMRYELEEQIDDLTKEIKTADEEASRELQARRHKLHKERQRLTLEELKKRRQSQPRNHQSHGAHEPSQGDRHRSFFGRVRHIMPKRNRLARTLFQPPTGPPPQPRRPVCSSEPHRTL